MLTSIHIQGFKGFRDTNIPELRRVNLILGGQNSGKTSLLEAVYLGHSPQPLDISDSVQRLQKAGFRKSPEQRDRHWIESSGGNLSTNISLLPKPPQTILSCFNVYPINEGELVNLYVTAVKRSRKNEWLSLLRLIEPRLEDLDQFPPEHEVQSVVHAKIGLHELIPLSQLGQGFNRLAYLYAGLLGQNANIALIDEIENGIHYTALPILWQGIANIARELDIQIFATTHSYECIQAAAKVFEATPQEFQLIRLERTEDNNIKPVLVQDENLVTVLQESYEIR
jgi:AAA domain, putative AbiEii toxin, Type IV TA system/AAA domain